MCTVRILAHSYTVYIVNDSLHPRILSLSLSSIAHIRERYWAAQIDDISL
jgi:hypothetical protein